MNEMQATEPETKSSETFPVSKGGVLGWRLIVLALAVSSGLVTLWNLATGERSEYYASIAMSMSKSISNFFFGAIDPAGTISLDKIPGSYWASAIFVKLFGFSTWSILDLNFLNFVSDYLDEAFSLFEQHPLQTVQVTFGTIEPAFWKALDMKLKC